MNLSPDEQLLLMRIARERGGRQLVFYAVVLTPIAAFGLFGMLNRDLTALVVAYFAALAYVVWHVSSGIQTAGQFRSIAQKVLEEREATKDHQSDA